MGESDKRAFIHTNAETQTSKAEITVKGAEGDSLKDVKEVYDELVQDYAAEVDVKVKR